MKRILLFVVFLIAVGNVVDAQELKARVTVNASKVHASKQLFASLEEQLNSFINDRRWSDLSFRENEKIECSFTIIVNEAVSSSSFKGELMIQSRRPVFNASYSTPILNYRDADFSFDYTEYQPLEFNSNNLTDNLTAIIAFYINFILGLDFDSMSPMGGTPFFRQMMTIATGAQSQGWGGWEYSSTARNRYTLADTFNNTAFEAYREMWYTYHRKGLDEMSENVEKSRENVLTSLAVISALHSQRPGSLLLPLFGEAKLDELIRILSDTDRSTKREGDETLRKVYPSRSAEIDKLK